MPRSRKSDVDEVDVTADPIDPDLEVADEDDDDDDESDAPLSAATKASAQKLIELLIEKKALQLQPKRSVGPELVEAVGRTLEWPGPPGKKAERLSEILVDSDDVDELFVDDETLAEIVKRW